ncbi:hypothetical protein CDAR_217961 [Caerostris darwini]|uniref:Uncharacterized protein n=1 Tax=Caerostris darwini TaxID=1538125 RepID=A0AAV4VLQ4_9ARAC|nr:hypothetical protein CDAR_217961 [Caerostris darwini]
MNPATACIIQRAFNNSRRSSTICDPYGLTNQPRKLELLTEQRCKVRGIEPARMQTVRQSPILHDTRPESLRSTTEIGAPDRVHRDAKFEVSNLSARKPFVMLNFWSCEVVSSGHADAVSWNCVDDSLPQFVAFVR